MRLGIGHARRNHQGLRYVSGIIVSAVPDIVGAAKRCEIPRGLGCGLHVIQKRKHALDRVHAVSGSHSVKNLQACLGNPFPNDNTWLKLHDDDVELIFGFGAVLSRSQRRSQESDQGQKQGPPNAKQARPLPPKRRQCVHCSGCIGWSVPEETRRNRSILK